jgi:YegS/Rv2252/BmrU family lipid kinase
VQEDYEFVIVCGGDGTINEAAQALVGSQTRLVIWPSGTANVLAKDLRLPRHPAELAELIAARSVRTISVGRAVKPEENWQRYFLLMAGIGLDAEIINGLNLDLKRRIGFGAYWAASLDYLARWPLKPFSLTVNEQTFEATFAIVANAPSYAGWFTLAPGARLEDEKLDVCLFSSRSRIEYLSYALQSLRGSHTSRSQVTYLSAQEAAACAMEPIFVQLDGELVGSLPMRFECVPRALRVVAPG